MTEPKTPMPELMRECQRKGGDTFNTRMVIVRVEMRRMAIALRTQSAAYRFAAKSMTILALLTKPHKKLPWFLCGSIGFLLWVLAQ